MEFLKKAWPILAAVALGLVLIICDVCTRGTTTTAEDQEIDYEEYARQTVESSLINVGGTIYHGTFSGEEITEVPEGYTLYGVTQECVGEGEEPVNELSSNLILEGYEVYTNANRDSLFLRVTTDEDQFQSYIEYVK